MLVQKPGGEGVGWPGGKEGKEKEERKKDGLGQPYMARAFLSIVITLDVVGPASAPLTRAFLSAVITLDVVDPTSAPLAHMFLSTAVVLDVTDLTFVLLACAFLSTAQAIA